MRVWMDAGTRGARDVPFAFMSESADEGDAGAHVRHDAGNAQTRVVGVVRTAVASTRSRRHGHTAVAGNAGTGGQAYVETSA